MANTEKPGRQPLPTHEEIDAMILTEFPQANAQCHVLCEELQEAVDALDDDPPPAVRQRLLARMGALSRQMRNLHCPTCFLQ